MSKRTRQYLRWAALVLLLAAAGYAAWRYWLAPTPLPAGLVQASGRIEGEHVTVSSQVPGRVVEVAVDEGQDVAEGQVLARLDDDRVSARVERARAGVQAMEREVDAFESELKQVRRDVPLAVRRARDAVAEAEAALEEARAREEQAGRDARRFRELERRDTVSRQRRERAVLNWTVARKELDRARETLQRARKELGRTRLENLGVAAKQSGYESLLARVDAARAELRETQAALDDLTVTAPRGGVITEKIVEAGEVVVAGGPLFDLVDLGELYLKAYVPETEVGRLALGQPARIFADAWPDRHFNATVGYIADTAEFTPKQVQTRQERTKLVYAVKLYLDANPGRRLTPGLPADAVIRTREDAPWSRPRW